MSNPQPATTVSITRTVAPVVTTLPITTVTDRATTPAKPILTSATIPTAANDDAGSQTYSILPLMIAFAVLFILTTIVSIAVSYWRNRNSANMDTEKSEKSMYIESLSARFKKPKRVSSMSSLDSNNLYKANPALDKDQRFSNTLESFKLYIGRSIQDFTKSAPPSASIISNDPKWRTIERAAPPSLLTSPPPLPLPMSPPPSTPLPLPATAPPSTPVPSSAPPSVPLPTPNSVQDSLNTDPEMVKRP